MAKPDPSLIAKTVRPEVAHAYEIASKALASLGIRHVVVGGLAVIANGYSRLTKDVNSWLVKRRSSNTQAAT